MHRSGALTYHDNQAKIDKMRLVAAKKREHATDQKRKWRANRRKEAEAQSKLENLLAHDAAAPLKLLNGVLFEDGKLKPIPEIARDLRLAEATKKIVLNNVKQGEHSWVLRTLMTEVSREAEFTAKEMSQMFPINKQQAHNLLNRVPQGEWKEKVTKVAREYKPSTKFSRIRAEERKLIRTYVRSMCKAVSNSDQYRCTLTKDQLYTDYVLVGAPSVYWSMLDLPKFKKMADDFDPLSKDPIKNKGLSQSLFYTRKWASEGFETARPSGIWARSKRTFFKILKERKKTGPRSWKKKLNLVFSTVPHPCPLCESYTDTIRKYNRLSGLYKGAKTAPDRTALEARIRPVYTKLQELKDHLIKFQVQRKELKELETNIPKGTVLVLEDYCSRYQSDGTKMANLILTLIYSKNGKIVREYHDTFSYGSQEDVGNRKERGKQDRYMYRDVWLNHLKNGIFDAFDTIIKSGDNGGSLKNYDTYWFSSTLWETHKKRVLWHTLCPYHSYNLCDPHGGRNNQLFKALERHKGHALGTPQDHADAINDAINTKGLENTKKAHAINTKPKPDEIYMPRGKFKKKESDPFGIKSICVTFPETPNIHDTSKHPKTSIRWQGLGMVTNTLGDKNGVAILDLRPIKRPSSESCSSCSKVFGYRVLQEEHDQRNHWLCPKTQIYTREDEPFDRYCRLCEGTVSDKHKRGTKFHCPTKDRKFEDMPHQTFNAYTMKGEHQQLKICRKRPSAPTGEELKAFKEEFENTMQTYIQEASRHLRDPSVKVEKNMFVIWKREDHNDDDDKLLPWVLGKCIKIDKKSQAYLMRVYAPISELGKVLWDCKFRHTQDEVSIPFGTQIYCPVKRYIKAKTIATDDILNVAESGKYGWDLDSLCSTPSWDTHEANTEEEEEKKSLLVKYPIEEIEETKESINEFKAYLKEPEEDDEPEEEVSSWSFSR